MPLSSPIHSAALAKALEAWFAECGKDYPWRRTRDAYAILVSEVMLQQTQISTVLDRGYYQRWLERFPDFQSLAEASEEVILQAWEGLGYYRRARNLQKLARVVMERHGGVLPADPALILALPGIGPYTAGALSSFAFGLPEPIVDGNVSRVLARLFHDATPIDSREGIATQWSRARELVVAASDPAAFNSALMELGQTICRTGQPDCESCPVRRFCQAVDPASLPVKTSRTVLTDVTERVFFRSTIEGVMLQQETGNRRTGLWKLPALPEGGELPPVLLKSKYGITRYRVTLWVHAAPEEVPEVEGVRLIRYEDLFKTPMPSPYRRALDAVMEGQGEFVLE
jgi:A/G-specific adenine glycosylase